MSSLPQPLLEIIPHEGTTPSALATAYDLGLKQGKTIIVVKDVPGFYVNRSLAPWATEALLLVEQGVAPDALDRAVRNFGYPVGPVTLADEVRRSCSHICDQYRSRCPDAGWH